jgi:hypothetical protein
VQSIAKRVAVDQPELSRLLLLDRQSAHDSPTNQEELFVTLVILHLNAVYHAMKRGMFIKPEGIRRDIRWFFRLPIPYAVWQKLQVFQDHDFVHFVEEAMDL